MKAISWKRFCNKGCLIDSIHVLCFRDLDQVTHYLWSSERSHFYCCYITWFVKSFQNGWSRKCRIKQWQQRKHTCWCWSWNSKENAFITYKKRIRVYSWNKWFLRGIWPIFAICITSTSWSFSKREWKTLWWVSTHWMRSLCPLLFLLITRLCKYKSVLIWGQWSVLKLGEA